ncbi:35121_t:CDS:2 [Gigaspora margarita]|uniref:35121_t:CDS:1 n=1 Tax=Gigaspora margarita TaxID=4874 RepID=A0ABN7UGG6_GIGMA|nr:35121_t:CDS:2 [Gigaspora margarita]
MTQPSKILIFILYDILKILTPAFADKSLDKFINSTNDTKLTYDTSKNDTPIQLDSPENIDDLKLVVIITYIMVFFNTIGCSYVFYRSWLQWKISTKSLSMIFRLPFYTAIADAGIDIVGILNIFQIDENNIDEKDVKVKNNNNPGSELTRTRGSLEKRYGATNSICSDFLNNANNSSNNSVKELNNNPYNIEINIDINNFVTESEMALNYMLSLVNSARSDNGVEPPLQLDSLLIGTAQRHSERMEESDELSHDDVDGDFATRVTNSGYDWNAIGENIASGYQDEDSVMDGENILNPDFRDLGVGRSGNYWTQDFGRTFEESDAEES